MKQQAKNILNFLARFGISFLLLWYIYTKIDVEQTKEVLSQADISSIVIAFGIFIIVNFIILYRWFIFIRALELNVRTIDVTRYFFIGLFGNLFLPSAIGGDLIKILGLCRESSQKPRVVASVILDRLSGFAGIVLVAICSFVLGYKIVDDPSLIMPIALMGAGSIAIVAVLFNEKIYSFGCRVFNFWPKLKNSLMDMHYDISLLKGKQKQGWKAIGFSCFAQVVFALSWFFVGKGLHQDIPYVYFLIFVPILCVAASFPSIGGLGVREAGAAYLFAKVGVESGVAVSLSLMNFLFMILVGLIGGGVYVATISSRRVQRPEPAGDS